MKKYKRILTLVLLPIVAAGLIFVFKNKKVSEITAVDLISVTYNGTSTPDPVFTLPDMKPGDVYEKCFAVKNTNTTDSFNILMKGFKSLEEKEFADILEIVITRVSLGDLYGGSMGFRSIENFLGESEGIDLGSFSPGNENTYCILVKFPSSSENEYQQAKLTFDLSWNADIAYKKIPPECRNMTFDRIIEGTEGNDKIYGSIKRELILAYGGNDKVKASSGGDCIVGGDGDDFLDGESGDEVILGGDGNDRITAGKGNDIVYGGSGDNKIETGSDHDFVYGGMGNDKIDLGSGDDFTWSEDGNDKIEGGTGNDSVWGGIGNDTIEGGPGKDFLYGEDGNDFLKGNVDDDTLDGGVEYDDLNGNNGIDTCLNGETAKNCEI